MKIELHLWDGGGTLRLSEIELKFGGKGWGTWRCIEPMWINLFAWGKQGKFKWTFAGHLIECYDNAPDKPANLQKKPAFELADGPVQEGDKHRSGVLFITTPRNPAGKRLTESFWKRI